MLIPVKYVALWSQNEATSKTCIWTLDLVILPLSVLILVLLLLSLITVMFM